MADAAVSAAPDVMRLRLYIAGTTQHSLSAIANAQAFCETHFEDCHDLEIVDMMDHPLRALADGVIVTPTLIKFSPLPIRRVIGTLDDTTRLAQALYPD
jgi:circadian clock protein KaiB